MKITVELPDGEMYDLFLHQCDFSGLTPEEYILFLIKQNLRTIKHERPKQ